MMGQRFESVWDALENSAEEAENMRLRAALMRELQRHVSQSSHAPKDMARELAITEPRLDELRRGQVDRFTVDELVGLLGQAGFTVRLEVRPAA
jgi:predicted XRE-type DNA-binding protein